MNEWGTRDWTGEQVGSRLVGGNKGAGLTMLKQVRCVDGQRRENQYPGENREN